MTRSEYALAALPAVILTIQRKGISDPGQIPHLVAADCFAIADAMVKEDLKNYVPRETVETPHGLAGYHDSGGRERS